MIRSGNKESAIALRNYASTVISRDILDTLRRRKKHRPLSDEQVRASFDEQLASDADQRFQDAGLGLELADVLAIVDRWRDDRKEKWRKIAVLLQHKYVSEMSMDRIAGDLKISLATAYRYHDEAIAELRRILLANDG